MRFGILLLITTASVSASLTNSDNQNPIIQSKDSFKAVRKALKKADIIDEVLDDFRPECSLVPFYGIDVNDSPVSLGNVFEQSKTKRAPGLRLSCSGLYDNTGFAVALTDPDAKSRNNPKWSEMCHWVLTISSFNETEFEVNTQGDWRVEELVEYKSPGPPAKTGYHRYVFVVLAGDITNLTAPRERQHWGTGKVRHGVRDWAEKEGLKVVGANYFMEQNEDQ